MTSMSAVTERINNTILTLCPVTNISIGAFGDSTAITFVPDPSATLSQISAAQSAISSFDWSDAAQAAWETQQAQINAVADLLKTTDAYVLMRAVCIMFGLRLNELIAAYNADRLARSLTVFTPGPLAQCPASPITEASVKSDIPKIIQAGSVST